MQRLIAAKDNGMEIFPMYILLKIIAHIRRFFEQNMEIKSIAIGGHRKSYEVIGGERNFRKALSC